MLSLFNKLKKNKTIVDPLIKLLDDESGFDLLESVLKYLSSNDILNCLLVNKFWHENISQSDQFGEKVRLTVRENYHGRVRHFLKNDLLITLKSNRNYNEISLKLPRKMTPNHLLLVATFSITSLTSLIMDHHTFSNEIEMINFFGIIEPYIEKIDLRCVTFLRMKKSLKEKQNVNYQFPNLKLLKVKNCCLLLITDIFQNVKTLNQLSIETEDKREGKTISDEQQIIDKTKSIHKILITNVKITNLTLNLDQTDFDGIFKELVSLNRIRFKLEALSVNKFRKLDGNQANSDQIRNFCTFLLLKQAETLRELKLHQCYGNREFLESIIYSLDNLRSLTVGHAELYEKAEKTDDPPIKIPVMNVITGHSIEELSIRSSSYECDVVKKMLLKMLPNLKRFYIDKITQPIFKELARCNLKLKYIEVDQFLAYDPLDKDLPPDTDCLRNLKNMKINHHYAENFKDILRTLNYGCSDGSNFATVFLAAVEEFDSIDFSLDQLAKHNSFLAKR